MRERVLHATPELVSIHDEALLGRVTAQSIVAAAPIPAFDNSQMDGYAVRAADLTGSTATSPISLSIGRATAAGDAPIAHLPGTASPVMTGAAIPQGADTVVPIENVLPARFGPLSRAGGPEPTGEVSFTTVPRVGEFVRLQGEDRLAGHELSHAGARITPALIGAFAAAGIRAVLVRPRVRVLLCSTGDELADTQGPTTPEILAPGKIYDANGPMLAAAMREAGAEVRIIRVADNAAHLSEELAEQAGSTDLIVTSGGISAGAFEVVREALAPLGFDFHGVALQPGGPQGYGVLEGAQGSRVAVLCFPGNPVSSLLSAELFLLPTLRELAGLPRDRPRRSLPVGHDVTSPEHKHQVRRGTVDSEGLVHVSAPGSHLIADFADASVLVHLPVGLAAASAGTELEVWSLK